MIGAILIVSIAAVLGAVVSSYALGVTNDVGTPAPQASFEFNPDYVTGDIVVTMKGGDTLDGDQLKFSGAALEKTTYGNITEWAGKGVQAGDSAAVDVVPGETLELIWQSPEGGKTAMLAEYDVPDDVGPTASIRSLTATRNKIIVENLRFSRVNDGQVYLVVNRQSRGAALVGSGIPDRFISTSDRNLEINTRLRQGDKITVMVYETETKSNELTKKQCTFGTDC